MKLFKSKDFYSAALAVMISLAVVAVSVSAATTISTDISTGGALTVTGATALNGGLTMDTDKFTVANTSGNTAIAGTLGVTGVTTLVYASSTAITTSGALIVGTTTPTNNSVAELSASGSATTTLYLGSSGTSKGGCIQLEGPNDTVYRVYATTTGPLMVEAGACK